MGLLSLYFSSYLVPDQPNLILLHGYRLLKSFYTPDLLIIGIRQIELLLERQNMKNIIRWFFISVSWLIFLSTLLIGGCAGFEHLTKPRIYRDKVADIVYFTKPYNPNEVPKYIELLHSYGWVAGITLTALAYQASVVFEKKKK